MEVKSRGRSREFQRAEVAVERHQIPGLKPRRRHSKIDDRGKTVLPSDHGAVRHSAADVSGKARDEAEVRRPPNVGDRCDEDLSGFQRRSLFERFDDARLNGAQKLRMGRPCLSQHGAVDLQADQPPQKTPICQPRCPLNEKHLSETSLSLLLDHNIGAVFMLLARGSRQF